MDHIVLRDFQSTIIIAKVPMLLMFVSIRANFLGTILFFLVWNVSILTNCKFSVPTSIFIYLALFFILQKIPKAFRPMEFIILDAIIKIPRFEISPYNFLCCLSQNTGLFFTLRGKKSTLFKYVSSRFYLNSNSRATNLKFRSFAKFVTVKVIASLSAVQFQMQIERLPILYGRLYKYSNSQQERYSTSDLQLWGISSLISCKLW